MNQPLVSVVIPNYNYGRFLAQAIDSALAQTYPNVEIIVVDDGSTDDSAEILKSYSDKIRRIKQTNRGVSSARNNGTAASKGELVAFLDADDVWLPEKLEKQVGIFQADDKVGLVHCGMVDFEDNGNLLSEHLDGMNGYVALDLLRYRRSVILGGGSAVVVKRKAFEKTGGFDENLRVGEDWEFYYQAAKHYKVGFVKEVLLKYRLHSNNNFANNTQSVERMEKDLLYAYDKIFSADDRLKPIKNECYGRIHTIIAGSYFRIGRYSKFSHHTIKSLRYAPANIIQFAGFPLRLLQQRFFPTKYSGGEKTL